MRTLLHVFSTFKVGGPQVRFATIVNHFGRRWRHLVAAMDGATTARALLAEGLELNILGLPVRRGATLANLLPLRRVLDQLRPDLLVTSNWGTIDWALANAGGLVPHLHLEDGFNPDEADGQLARRVWTRRLVLRRTTVVVPSQTLATIARDSWKLPEDRVITLANGIDCARFAIAADPTFAARMGVPATVPVIGTVAGLRREKNLWRLLDAFAIVARSSPAALVVVGEGGERLGLEAYAASLGLAERVVFTGSCRHPEKLLPSFTLFALSSDTEQMPLSLLEAMAAGRPVAATDVGDVALVVAPENRRHIVAPDAAQLAAAMLALLDDPVAAQAIGRANAARAIRDFDQRRMFDSYRRLFDGELR